MSKKVGIITLTGANNYGNVLQNYAVQEIIKSYGFEVETIVNTTEMGHWKEPEKINKYTYPYVKKVIKSRLHYKYNIKNSGYGLIKALNYYRQNKAIIAAAEVERDRKFKKFTNHHIAWSNRTINTNIPWTKQMIDGYCMFVSGSDQVWNPNYLSTSAVNFLQFAPRNKRMTISPSFGVCEIPENLKGSYAKWLSEIDFLSIREFQGYEIIRELCGKEAMVLCDPTMALSRKKWEAIEEKPAFWNGKKYILTYFLGDRTKEYDTFINKIAKDNDLEIIHLFDILDLKAYATSPQEFIYLIHYANLVCTDSFHGAVFSILMHTDFVTFDRSETGGSMASRLDTLLETFNLEERNWKKVKNLFNINYEPVDKVLQLKQNEFNSFVSHALSSIESNRQENETKNVYEEKADCCGCNACVLSCHQNCIFMQQDVEGFSYPVIDEKTCINCNKCRSVCPISNKLAMRTNIKECFAAYSNDQQVRKNSSSGGIFTELAQIVLDKGGVVFGVGFDEKFRVKHLCVTKKNELIKLQGSKYVQSDIGDAYSKTREFLEGGRLVYFSGTPCQIKGLYTYLGKKVYSNLITQDFICHGVPSPKVWEKYVELHEKNDGIQNISFRDKKYGWHYFSMAIKQKKKEYRKRLDEDWYLRLFLDNTILRPICYECPMKKEGSCADVTLADCWNTNTVVKRIRDDDRGISLVFLRSRNVDKLWDELCNRGRIVAENVEQEIAVKSQIAIEQPAGMNPQRSMFFDALQKEEFENLYRNWYRYSLISKMRKTYIFYKTKAYKVLQTLKAKL